MKVKGNLIREARVKKGFKQDILADALGISQSQYSKLENGEAVFDVHKLSTLIDELDLNPLDVIEFSDKQQTFINSSMSGNHNNSNSFNNYDEEAIRNIVREEIGKKLK
jgi:transcriptional regulator with XRE-family HTH domain